MIEGKYYLSTKASLPYHRIYSENACKHANQFEEITDHSSKLESTL